MRRGDVIASGTCGDGSLVEFWRRSGRREPPPLQVGDVVTLTVERLGTITNTVVAAHTPRSPVIPARPPAELKAAIAQAATQVRS